MALFNLYASALKRETGTTCPPHIKAVAYITNQSLEWQRESYDGHKGWDLSTNLENWPVYAQDGGTVSDVYANEDARGWGVTIQSSGGYTRYMHFNARAQFTPGDKVAKGDYLGLSGGSGNGLRNKYDVHLHIDVFVNGVGYVDPLPFILGDKSVNGEVAAPVPPGNVYAPGDDVLVDRAYLGKVVATGFDKVQAAWVARVNVKGAEDVYLQSRLIKAGLAAQLDGMSDATVKEIAVDANGNAVARIETVVFAHRLR